MAIVITLNGLTPFLVSLAEMSNPVGLQAVVKAAAVDLQTKLKKYPPRNSPSRASVYGTAFKTDKQRRWFFAAGMPRYTRTSRLRNSWTVEMQGNTTAIIGTNMGYAGWVMQEGKQSQYMAAVGWKTAESTVQENEAAVLQTIEDELYKLLTR